MGRRLLFLLSQNPLDPAGGAARSLDSMCRVLARAGYDVEAIGTTSTEFADPMAASKTIDMLRGAGIEPTEERFEDARLIRFARDSVRYRLLDTGGWCLDRPHVVHTPRFARLYRELLKRFEPQIVLTFGAMPIERERHHEARARGAAVVLSIHQHTYYDRRAFETADAVYMCSEFLRQCYLKRIGIDSTVLLGPILPDDVVAASHEPVFVTFVNPSYEKGVVFIARLAEELATRRPDIPMLVIESRGAAGRLIAVGDAGGFDLRRHASLMTAPGVPMPRDIYALTRLMLVPSLWEEPWGRVAAEALFNGIPPLISPRGGLPEAACGGGIILPLPDELTPAARIPPPREAVEPWFEAICRLCDDEAAYKVASLRARDAAAALAPAKLLESYLDFFDHVQPHAI